MLKAFGRWIALLLLAACVLQLFFVVRIALMTVVNPQSTAFERSAAWRIARGDGQLAQWRQEWTPYGDISDNLKRAVIASEDSDFINHGGVDWEAIESAWQRNIHAEQAAERRAQRARADAAKGRPPKVIGGSTISQQLAKNLLLSGERTLVRKGQELVLTELLELFLGKRRILEIYLNNVEWGNGIYGAEAAARYYYRKPASRLTAIESARLAVMLPRPRYFEQHQNSGYLASRSATIVGRMSAADLP
jgi:monofunctional biosynthetic peptidoglycan transglycosylase